MRTLSSEATGLSRLLFSPAVRAAVTVEGPFPKYEVAAIVSAGGQDRRPPRHTLGTPRVVLPGLGERGLAGSSLGHGICPRDGRCAPEHCNLGSSHAGHPLRASPTGTPVEGSAEPGGSSGEQAKDPVRDPSTASPCSQESTSQSPPGASDPNPVTPRRSGSASGPGRQSSDDNEGLLAWFRSLLPDLRAVVLVVFHLAALVLTSKILGMDRVFSGIMQQIPSVRFVASDAAAATAGSSRASGSRREGASKARGSFGGKPITVLKDDTGRKPSHVVTHLVVPFSEFLYHVKKDNVQSVSVDGDKVGFVLRKVELIQPEHRAYALFPEIMALQQVIRSDDRLRSALEPSGSSVAGGSQSVATEKAQAQRKQKQSKEQFNLQMQLSTVKPADLSLPYTKLMSRNVEFGAPEKVPFRFVNNLSIALLYAGVLASVISRLTVRGPNGVGARKKNKKGRGPGVVFADVAGVDEAKEELEEIVEYLRMPERFTRLGARPPRGVLLVGPPGTGKTMLAKAVAGEAEVPFISCSGSEFIELYVGLGASRVRDLFAQAKKEAPSIVFIDEIDSVAKVRDGRARSVGNDEREQTLNQLLTEMDGFDSNTAVIVLAATNRADVLDPALRRPGRFDRIVAVEAPDRKGRISVLNVHLEKQQLPLADDVDVTLIATATAGFTGADLANLVNEAALLAAREQDCLAVRRVHFEKAVERAIAGIEKKRSALGRSEKAVVARHEVGHALLGAAVAKVLPNHSVVQKISIIPRSGGALGFAYIPPAPGGEERQLLFVDEMRGQLATLLGGRAAEEVAFRGRVSTGAMDDIRRATDLAYKGISEYGLSARMGPVSLSTLSGGASEGYFGFPDQGRLAEQVQMEVQAMLQEALSVARTVVERNVTLLHGLGAQLEEEESVDGETLRSWLDKVDPTKELEAFLQRASLPPGPLVIDVLPLPRPEDKGRGE